MLKNKFIVFSICLFKGGNGRIGKKEEVILYDLFKFVEKLEVVFMLRWEMYGLKFFIY